jgi:antitoxin (DNA-binding transcriptional repressor) of toxin-antitoxin stability system
MRTVQIQDASSSFCSLIAAAEAGEEIALTRQGRIVARILPAARQAPQAKWGEASHALETTHAHAYGGELLAPLD